MRKRVLLACECSGRVRDAFAALGWEAWSADLLPSETPARSVQVAGEQGYVSPSMIDGPMTGHYQGDCRDLFRWDHPVNHNRMDDNSADLLAPRLPLWDLIIAFPPCTRLSWAGNRYRKLWRENGEEDEGAAFFMEMIGAPSPRVAVENPRGVMFHRYRPPDQVIQPWQFGDPFRKDTCLWLKGLPMGLIPTHSMEDYPMLIRAATGGGSYRTDKAAGRKAMNAYEDSEGRVNRARVRSRTFPGIAKAMAEQWSDHVTRELSS